MSRRLFVLLVCLAWCLGGCARTKSAATLPDGSKIEVLIVTDRNYDPATPPERRRQLDQLLGWMEDDLAKLLRRVGYAARPSAEAPPESAVNRYVLQLGVTHYQRIGAAMTRLDAHFDLMGPGGSVRAGDSSVAAAVNWKKAARLVGKEIRDAVNGRIRLEH